MGLLVAGLCIWRCDFKRNTPVRKPIPKGDAFNVDFVKDRQSVYGQKNKFWDSHDEKKWLCHQDETHAGAILGHYQEREPVSGWYSGMIPQYQSISVEKAGEGTKMFHWYPDPDRLNVKLNREMDPSVFNGNLNWNSRVIVMDLLLLFEEDDQKERKMKRQRLKKLFPILCGPGEAKYETLRARHLGLWIFFVYFWNPALKYFRNSIISPSSNNPDEEAAAVGEVCHVLGITCRTQWMQIGFLQDCGDPTQLEEYLPCRCDRLIDLLIRHEQEDFLKSFVTDMKDVYERLRARYLQKEVEIDNKNFNKEQAADTPHCKDLKAAYLMNTKHFRLDDCFFADHGNGKEGGWCDDPRTKNVYLFALLDVS